MNRRLKHPHDPSRLPRSARIGPRAVLAAALLATALGAFPGAPVPPADAAARVSVANPDGAAVIDTTYATTLTVRGRGFQSVTGGHGGVYVFFGTVNDGWQPSRGGRTGADYLYVPDSEAADNQGFQRLVAFPGSDTADSANGGTIAADGSWSTSIVVPGATFQTVDRSGQTRTVDCTTSTCGIITIGAHGVSNANNETFTPVRVADLYASAPAQSATSGSTAAAGSADPAAPASEEGASEAAAAATPAVLEVDRTSAIAGRVLPFWASGLPAGRQVSVTFDDGAAAAGPFQVGADGTLAGVITLPEDTASGTHELRMVGLDDEVTVGFAVQSAESSDSDEEANAGATNGGVNWFAVAFVVFAALVLAAALVRLLVLLLLRRSRTAAP